MIAIFNMSEHCSRFWWYPSLDPLCWRWSSLPSWQLQNILPVGQQVRVWSGHKVRKRILPLKGRRPGASLVANNAITFQSSKFSLDSSKLFTIKAAELGSYWPTGVMIWYSTSWVTAGRALAAFTTDDKKSKNLVTLGRWQPAAWRGHLFMPGITHWRGNVWPPVATYGTAPINQGALLQ
jgi:hypothetical protein